MSIKRTRSRKEHSPMSEVWQAAVQELEGGRDVALATILAVRGSSPRHVGTRLLVRQDGSIVGTIGGGLFEADVEKLAARALQNGESWRSLFSFRGRDAHDHQMICGGEADVLIEVISAQDGDALDFCKKVYEVTASGRRAYLLSRLDMPQGSYKNGPVRHLLLEEDGQRWGGFPGDDLALDAMPSSRLLKPAQVIEIPGSEYPIFLEWLRQRGTVYVFGAGHVGLCVAHLAAYVDFKVVVVDDRADYADSSRFPEAHEVKVVESFTDFFSQTVLDEDSYVVIVTRGHSHDRTVLNLALKTRAGYIGMIGSRRKTNLIFQALLMEGFSSEDLQRVYSPIGLPIGGETPQEIGISIVAQIVDFRSRKDRIERRED